MLRNHTTMMIIGGMLAAGCATVPVGRVGDGAVPTKLAALEQRVLEEARTFESMLDQRGAILEHPPLDQHLNTIGQRLVRASDTPTLPIRFRIVRDPSLNAYTLAHGTILLTTGLLIQLHNDEELALIMSHELAHVLHRDMLAYTQALHSKTVSAKIADLLLTPPLAVLGIGFVGEAGVGRIYQASVAGYAQEQESQADLAGLALLQRAGFDPPRAAHAFTRLVEDETVFRYPRHWAYVPDHPTSQSRLAALTQRLGFSATTTLPPPVDDASYLALVDPLRLDTITLHHRLREYMHALRIAEELLRRQPQHLAALCALGDTYRLMADDPAAVEAELNPDEWRRHTAQHTETSLSAHWRANAAQSYQRALALNTHYPEAHRGLGLLALATDEPQARAHLTAYLTHHPHAADRRYILHQLEQLPATGSEP